jgi:hypothetical protein
VKLRIWDRTKEITIEKSGQLLKSENKNFGPAKFLKVTMKEEITFYNYHSSLSRHSSKVEQEKSYPVSGIFIVAIPIR